MEIYLEELSHCGKNPVKLDLLTVNNAVVLKRLIIPTFFTILPYRLHIHEAVPLNRRFSRLFESLPAAEISGNTFHIPNFKRKTSELSI